MIEKPKTLDFPQIRIPEGDNDPLTIFEAVWHYGRVIQVQRIKGDSPRPDLDHILCEDFLNSYDHQYGPADFDED